MAIPDSQYVDLLVKKLDGVAKTDTATNKSPSNESIPSPALNRGDTCWTQANELPTTAIATTNLVEEHINSNAIQCTADTTCVPIGGIYPTWLTGITEWIPPDFGSTYTVQAYVGPPGAANIIATGTFISNAGQAGVGDWFFDYQAGLLNFIGETIPASLTSGNVVYITGYNYIGLTGVTNLPSNTTIGNINIVDTTLTSTDINGNLITFEGSSGIVIPSGNSSQRPGSAVLGTTRFNTTIDSIEAWDGAQWVTSGNVIVPGTIVDQQIIPDGTANTYTLVQSTTTDAVLVSINGVNQLPNVAYIVANTSITFTQTPLTQDLIDIRFISYATTVSYLANGSGNASVVVTPEGNIVFTTNGNVLSTMSGNTVSVIGGISAAGNITTSGVFVGTFAGNISGNIVAPGSNTQVIYNNNGNLQASSGFIFDQSSNILSVSGNIIGGNILSSGVISAVGLVVSGNISGTNITGNLISGNQANITNVGTLSSLNVNGNLTGSNISATFISANTINAANIGNTGTEFTGTNLSITGNVIASSLTGTLTTAAQTNITSVGALTSLSVTGDVSLTGNIVVPSTLSVTGNISASGNINAPYFIGNGSQLTGLPVTYGNSNVVNLLNTGLGGNIIPSANAVYTLGNATNQWAEIYVSGNSIYIGGANLSSDGINLSFQGNTVLTTTGGGNLDIANTLSAGNITTSGIVSASGNIQGSNFNTGGIVSASGNIIGNNLVINSISSAGNIAGDSLAVSSVSTSGNILVSGLISADGNITGNYINGNGSHLFSITAANITGTVANATYATSAGNATTANTVINNGQPNITSVGTLVSLNSGVISSSGNVTGANILSGGFLSVTGAATLGNILTAGFMSASGNVLGNNIFASGAISAAGNITGNNLNIVTISSSGNITTTNITGTTVSTTGNITAPFFIGDLIGNISGNLVVPGANTQIIYNNAGQANASAGLTFDFASNSLVSTGNITGANILTAGLISVTGNVLASRFIGNGSTLSSITGSNVIGAVGTATFATTSGSTTTAATVTTNAQPNITSVGTLSTLSVSGNAVAGNYNTAGNISATGNISTAGYFLGNFQGNISGNIVVPGSNTQVLFNDNGNAGASSGLTFDAASNILSAAGNVVASRFIGNGSTLSSITASNIVGAVANATFATSAGTVATVTSNAQPNITSVGTLSNVFTSGQVSAAGNITTSGFFLGTFAGNISGNLTVPGSNTQVIYNNNGNAGASAGFTFDAASNILSAAGNVIASRFIGNGSTLSSITGANVTGNVASATFATSAGTVATVTSNAQPNITSVGTLSNVFTSGQVSAAGNITTAGFFLGTFAGNISGNLTVPGSNTQVIYNNNGNAGASAGFTFDAASNAMVVTGNVTGGNILTAGLISSTGNAIHGNILTAGLISATSTITSAANIVGGNITTVGLITATGNVTGGNILTSGLISVTGNITGSNLATAGQMSGQNLIVTNNITFSTTGGNLNMAGQTTGTITLGGTAQTGTITLGQSTANQTVNIASGLTASGNTKTVNIGSGGLAGSNTTITVGADTGNATVTFTANTKVAIANTSTTALSVAGAITAGTTLFGAGLSIGTGGAQIGANVTVANLITGGLITATGNITGGNLSVRTGTITVGNIVNSNGNAVGNIGSASNYFNTVFAQATSALYADLAENYLADAEYAPGTVVSFGGYAELTLSIQDQDPTVAGIVSTNPAYHMNSGLEGEFVTPLTLSGRVPCLVQGPVTAGSMMVSAGNGRARAEKNPAMGTVIGKAINSFDGDIGVIEIVVGRV